MTSRRVVPGLVALALAGVLLAWVSGVLRADPRGGTEPGELPTIRLADLPPEARRTVGLVDRGGPFPYPERDGATFGNFDAILPDRPDGYYEEYTVPTSGGEDRGERLVVVGERGELYWTEDEAASFSRIAR